GAGVDLSGLIQVSGVSMTGFQLGERLGEGDDFSTATLVTIIAALEQYNLVGEIASIDLTTPLAVTMETQHGLTVFVGQPTELNEKIASLQKLLPQFVSQSISVGTLYLSAKGGTVYSPSSDGARLPTITQEPEYDEEGNLIPPAEDGGDEAGGDGDTDGAQPADPDATPSPTSGPTPVSGGDDPFSG
ncbi:MAG: hypothetical protein Q4C13_09030, partial [Clostridia bacterium]|nr:hypothetical protein [Clostridia bacterium]